MSTKTYFFRDDNYSLFEMIYRIPNDNFIDLINTYSNQKFLTREASLEFFLRTYDTAEQEQIIAPCFNIHGKKGDLLNVQLYKIETTFLNLNFTAEEIDIINSLQGKLLNDIPLLGSYCSSNCILTDISIISEKVIDFKFSFEVSSYKEIDGEVQKVIKANIIECRYYVEFNIVCLIENRKTEQKQVLNVVSALPMYITMMLEGSNTIKYSEFSFSEIQLNPSELQLLKLFLNAKLKAGEFDVDGEKGVTIKISGVSLDFETESSIFKDTRQKGKFKGIVFYWIDTNNIRSIITIRNNSEITSTNYANIDTLNRIIELIFKIKNYKEFLERLDEKIQSYCKKSNPAILPIYIERKKSQILDELTKFIKSIGSYAKKSITVTELYLNIIANIIFKLAMNNINIHDELSPEFNCRLSSYSNLFTFLNSTLSTSFSITITDEIDNAICENLLLIINNTTNEEDLINYYQSNY